jgi:exopolysaccharide biosynthesis polyprenyl glycosylphosphotransferase
MNNAKEITNPSRSETPVASSRVRPNRLRWSEVVLLLAGGDVLAIVGGAALAFGVWSVLPVEFAPGPYLGGWIAGSLIVWMFALRLFDGYDVVAPSFWRSTLASVFRAFLAVMAATAAVFFVLPFVFPRGIGLLAPVFAVATLIAWRSLFARLVRGADLARRVIFLGADEANRRVADLLMRSRSGVSYRPVAFLTGNPESPAQISGLPTIATPDRLWDVVHERRVDEIIVGTEPEVAPLGQLALVECFSRGVTATPAVALYEALTGRVLAASLGTSWFMQIPTDPRRPYLVVKRAIDVVTILLVLPLVLVAIALVGIAVLVGSGRPVLYRQVRVGQRGERFTIHKFRTMATNAEADGPQFAVPGDARRTSIGRFLRRTRMDELPQLFDVLRGHMSLIGPRPERPEFAERLREKIPIYEARLLVRPGLTGWAQTRLPYAADLEESLMKLEYDLYYVKHVGPILDLSIVLRTIGIVLRFAGR